MKRNTFNRPTPQENQTNRFEQLAIAAPVISTIYESSGSPLMPVGDGVTSTDSTPVFEGTAAPGSLVSIWADGVKVGEGYANQFGIFNFEITTPLSVGPQLISARAELNNETSLSSAPQTVIFWNGEGTVDPVPPVEPPVDPLPPIEPPVDPLPPVEPPVEPTVPFIAPGVYNVVDNQGPRQGRLQYGASTDDASPTLYGHADRNALVYIFDNGQPAGSVQADRNGMWSYEPALNNGEHTLTFGGIDSTGEMRISPESFALTVAAPVAAAIVGALNDAGDNVGAQTDDSRPTLFGTGAPNGTVFILDNGRMLGTAPINEKGEWSFTPDADLVAGDHIFYIEVAGPDGSFSSAPQPLELNIVNGELPPVEPPVDPLPPVEPPVEPPVDPLPPVEPPVEPPVDPLPPVEPPVEPEQPAPELSVPVIEGAYDNRSGEDVRIEDGLTQDSTPVLKGTADPFAIVGLFDASNNLVALTEANAQGEWAAELPGVGGNQFYAKSMDPDNYSNSSEASDPIEIFFDFSGAFTPFSTETLLQDGNELLFPQKEQAVNTAQPAEPMAYAPVNTGFIQQDLDDTATW